MMERFRLRIPDDHAQFLYYDDDNAILETDYFELKMPGGGGKVIFDTQSIASGASNHPSEPTPAAADPAKVDESETQESGVSTAPVPVGGTTAEESLPWIRRMREAAGPQSAPTSPPITKEDSPPTKSGPTTTPSAACVLNFISHIMEQVAAQHHRAGIINHQAERLHQDVLWMWRQYFASTTQAPAAPGLDAETPTSPDTESTERKS